MVKLSSQYIKEKNSIRKSILLRLRSQDKKERLRKSLKIKRRLFNDKDFQAAKTVMFYISKDYEVDTKAMIAKALDLGKRVVVPVTETNQKRLIPSEITDPKGQLHKGPFGVYEPKRECIKAVKIKEIDMVITPGIAFDKKGNRIGHGKGYFDRFLKNLPKAVPTIGLAFRFQLARRIKSLKWDVPVTKIITA
jgi:5-formyltetrahydrofolate cyclo-ligase